MSALAAFEAAARYGNFSRAARELGTSQSAISRHIAILEKQLSARLFDRSRTGVSLTAAGHCFHKAVLVGLGALRAGAAEVAQVSDDGQPQAALSCTADVQHIHSVPRLEALGEAPEERIRVRILARFDGILHLPPEPAVDVVLIWGAGSAAPVDGAVLAGEAPGSCRSPGYAAAYAAIIDGPAAGWAGG